MNKVIRASLAIIALSTVFFVSAAVIAKKEQVRHVVIFKFKPTTTPEQIDQVTQELGALKSKIPGIVSFEHGVNDSPEKKNLGFTHAYLITFENAAARDTYLPHPEHKKFGQMLGKLGVMDDVFVVDYAPESK